MFQRSLTVFAVSALLIIPAAVALGQDTESPVPATFTFTSFDVPGAVTVHVPGISATGEIVGYYTDSSGFTKGFIRRANGTIVAPIIDPNDTGNFTVCYGVNKSGTVGGEYFVLATNTYHGFFLSKGVFTTFDYPGPYSTIVAGINNTGNFVGSYGSSVSPNQGFISISGVLTSVSYPGSISGGLEGINNSNTAVGEWTDASNVVHGLHRASSGALASYDVPGSTYTYTEGINDFNVIVGAYKDGASVQHGFMLKKGALTTIDYPGGSTETTVGAINNGGTFAGHYIDAAGVWHGYFAK